MKWVCLWHCFLATVFLVSVSYGDDSLDIKRKLLLAGMRAQRETLRSGHASLTGEHSLVSGELGEIRVPVRFDFAFDRDNGCERREEHDFMLRRKELNPELKALLSNNGFPHGQDSTGNDWFTEASGSTLVQTPKFDLHLSRTNSLSRLQPGVGRKKFKVWNWDFRSFGLVDFYSLQADCQFENVISAIDTELTWQAIEADENGFTRIVLRSKPIEWSIWIDEKRGMTPVKLTRIDYVADREESWSNVTWMEINNVWVPTSMSIHADNRRYLNAYELTIDWENVNTPLDPKLFTAAGLTDDESATITDLSLGHAITERVSPHPVPIASKPRPIAPKPEIPGATRTRWLLPATLIGLASIFCWIVLRRRRLDSKNSQ